MSSRKKWVRYSALILFCIGISGFFGIGLSLTFVTWGTAFLLFVWENQTEKYSKQEYKKEYISQFSPTNLCVSLQNLNLVYQIVEKNDEHYKVQLVWSGDEPKEDSKIYDIPSKEVMQFDLELFLNLT